MAIRFMHKYQKHILFFIVVPLLAILGVGSAIFYTITSPGNDPAKTPAGKFEIVPGERMELTYKEYGSYLRRYLGFNRLWNILEKQDMEWQPKENEVWEHILRVKAAEAAGLHVSEREVADRVYGMLGRYYNRQITQKEIRDWLERFGLSRMGVTPKVFMHGVKEHLLTEKLVAFEVGSMKFDSQSLWSDYKSKNGDFVYEYITFKREDYREDWSPVDIKQEELEEFWDGPRSRSIKEKYREPQRISYEVVTLEPENVPPSKLEAFVQGLEVTEEQMKSFYEAEQNQDRWWKEMAEESPEEESPKEEKTGEEKETEKKKKVRMTFDEAKEDIRRELKITLGLEKIRQEGQSAGDPFFLQRKSEEFGLAYFRSPSMQTEEEVKNEPLLQQISFQGMALGEVLWSIAMTAPKENPEVWIPGVIQGEGEQHPICIFRIMDRPEPRVPSLREIETEVREDLLASKAFEKAGEAAQEFVGSVIDKARELHKEEGDRIRGTAPQEAEREILAQNITDPNAQAKIRQKWNNITRKDFEKLWKPSCADFFDEIVKEKGYVIRRLGVIKLKEKTYPKVATSGALSYSDINLGTIPRLQFMQEGEVQGGFPSMDNQEIYVVKMVKKRVPTMDQVTRSDIEKMKRDKFSIFRRSTELKWNSNVIHNQYRLRLFGGRGKKKK